MLLNLRRDTNYACPCLRWVSCRGVGAQLCGHLLNPATPLGLKPSLSLMVVLQDPEDLRRLVRCMAGGGLMPMDEAGVHMVPVAPYEFLQTAEYNARAVAFLPKGTMVRFPLPHRGSVAPPGGLQGRAAQGLLTVQSSVCNLDNCGQHRPRICACPWHANMKGRGVRMLLAPGALAVQHHAGIQCAHIARRACDASKCSAGM